MGSVAIAVKGQNTPITVSLSGIGAMAIPRKQPGGCSSTGGAQHLPLTLLLLAGALALFAGAPRMRRALRRR